MNDNNQTDSPVQEIEEQIGDLQDTAQEKAEELQGQFQRKTANSMERLRNMVGEGNRRTLVVERDGRVIAKVPLSAGVAVGVAMLALATPVAVITFVTGLFLGLSLRVEPAEGS